MSGELLLINPRRKRRKGRRRRRSMSALQRRYFGGRKVSRARRNPRRRRSSTAALSFSAPVRRSRRRSGGFKRRSFSRRRGGGGVTNLRNFNIRSFVSNALLPAGMGAVGALGLDIALAQARPYLPDALASGLGNTAARLGGALLIGYVTSLGMGRAFGEQAAAGALTVTMYDLIKGYFADAFPSIPLSGAYDDASGYSLGYAAAAPQVGAYVSNGMGAYVSY